MTTEHKNDIRYVCLSDLHFGEKDSLLTCLREQQYECDPTGVSPVAVQLVTALRDLIGRNEGATKPTLILNGDILDLAFSSIGESLTLFSGFLDLIVKPGEELFDRIVYLPGNHDHHIWEIARETQYVNTVLEAQWERGLPEPAHVTPLDGGGRIRSYLLNQLLRRVRGLEREEPLDYELNIIYPNMALVHEHEDRGILIHHGHYCEEKYWVISKIRRWLFPGRDPMESVQELEGENFAWIDFVWSLLGRSGEAGAEVETLYKKLQYERHADEFIDEISQRIAKATDIPLVPGDWLEAKVLKIIFERVGRMASSERCHDDRCVSDEIDVGLRKYLFGPAYHQMRQELGRIPGHLTFLFGHTHKPFEQTIDDTPDGSRVALCNTGGWTVDSAESNHSYGAAVAMVSSDLRVAALRTFNLGAGMELGIRVARTADPDERADEFAAQLAERIGIDAGRGPASNPLWQAVSDRIATAVLRRERQLSEQFLE